MMTLLTPVLLSALASAPAAPTTAPLITSESPAHLPIINDDFAHALTEAKGRKVPIFVEVWAPW